MTKKSKDNDTVEKTLIDLGIAKSNGAHAHITTNNEIKNDVKIENNNIDYEYYLYCKHQLEILIASGKCKDFIGKNITYQELDIMKPEQIIKSFKIYEAARSARINDSISDTFVKCYSKLCNNIIPIQDENKLYNELKNDYLIMTELNKWIGYLSYQLGGVMTLISTGVITFSNIKRTTELSITKLSSLSYDKKLISCDDKKLISCDIKIDKKLDTINE